ncbi:MAG TPA: DegV family protein [Dehalococcoidia bacterium]|nr:DegV family protein [Dehalococcoidia bacterium]
MSVRIVTDSTSDIPPHMAQALGISVVPLSVIFGEEAYKENVEISPDLFYERLQKAKDLPTTSAPSVGDFLQTYREVLKETNEIVSIHLSSKLSATYSNACQAAAQLNDEGARIDVVDSKVISLGMLFLARASAKAAAAGATVDAIKKMIEGMIPRTHIYVLLDTLEYVRRGGRIGRARAFIGTMMRVKPVLSIRDGEVHPEERVRTRVHALDRVFQMATSFPEIEEIGVAYSTNAAEAEGMRRRLQEALGDKKVEVTRLGPVIGVHGGPGVLGIGILEGER